MGVDIFNDQAARSVALGPDVDKFIVGGRKCLDGRVGGNGDCKHRVTG